MSTIAQEFIQEGIEQVARKLLRLHDLVTVSELTGLRIERMQEEER